MQEDGLFQVPSSRTRATAVRVFCTYTSPQVCPHQDQGLESLLRMFLNVTQGPRQLKCLNDYELVANNN